MQWMIVAARLVLIIHLDNNHSDHLVVSVIRYLWQCASRQEEDEELAWSAVVEASAALVVVVVDDIRAILAVGLAGA